MESEAGTEEANPGRAEGGARHRAVGVEGEAAVSSWESGRGFLGEQRWRRWSGRDLSRWDLGGRRREGTKRERIWARVSTDQLIYHFLFGLRDE
jgi:hypothetical protein